RLVVATIDLLTRGHGRNLPISQTPQIDTFLRQDVSRISASLTPTHRMAGAEIRISPLNKGLTPPQGMGRDIMLTADADGQFAMKSLWPYAATVLWEFPLNFDAARIDPVSGEVQWTLSLNDSGAGKAFAARNIMTKHAAAHPLNLVMFRCAPVALFAMPDPTTLQPFASVGFLESGTMAAPKDSKVEPIPGGGVVAFVPPESRLYFTFKKGSRETPTLMEVRAFALHAQGPPTGESWPPEAGEIYGRGY